MCCVIDSPKQETNSVFTYIADSWVTKAKLKFFFMEQLICTTWSKKFQLGVNVSFINRIEFNRTSQRNVCNVYTFFVQSRIQGLSYLIPRRHNFNTRFANGPTQCHSFLVTSQHHWLLFRCTDSVHWNVVPHQVWEDCATNQCSSYLIVGLLDCSVMVIASVLPFLDYWARN